MYLTWILSVISAILTLTSAHRYPDPDPIINTCHGPVRGTILLSRENRTYYAFKGIPYAKPPVGDLRFKAPVPPNEWENILDVQEDGPVCMQKNFLFANPVVEGSEDCLNINVYTPKLSSKKYASKSKLLPVLVFINWGGFFAGYGNSSFLGPEYFMDKDIIVVTFNYRLGVLGFLSTDDDASPGNWGLKDQVAALKWVRDNIERFGGNSKRVTIYGQSAGSASVHYHMLSPAARHLFHGAISASGTALNLWAKPINALAPTFAKQQGAFVGCPNDTDTYGLVDCLRKIDAKTLVESGDNFKYFSIEPLTVFTPVTEKKSNSNPCPYITKDPLQVIEDNEFQKIPWIIGVVQDEGLIRSPALLRQNSTRAQLNAAFDQLMPIMMALSLSVPQSSVEEIWDQIKEFYFDGANTTLDPLTPKTIQGLTNLYSDRSFIHDIYQTALIHAAKGHNLIWMYNFAYKGEYSYADHFAATSQNIDFDWGVGHCDDLIYLFRTPALFPDLQSNSTDILVSNVMVKLFADFATYGNPVPTGEALGISVNWDKLPNLEGETIYKNEYITFLNISGPYHLERIPIKLSMEHGFHNERMKFWQELPLAENINGIE